MKWTLAPLFAGTVAFAACTIPGGGGGGGGTGGDYVPFQEVYDAGLTRYVGSDLVQPVRVTSPFLYRKLDVHHFDTDPTLRGPLCMRGDEFFVETRDGGSDALVIFLQGGGVCANEVCAATVKPLLNLRLMTTGDLVGIGGLLDRTDDRNPVADFDLVHVPYCDGSIFMGDVDRILSDGDPDNGTADIAYQRGLQNLTAAFEVAKSRYPNPSRVIIAGTSGGSYGSVAAVALARYYYPEQNILAIADSGAPILTDSDVGFVDRILREFDARRFVPPSCVGCLDDGHVTGVIDWALERDPNIRIAYMGHTRDFVIGEYYMGGTADGHEAAVARESGELVDAWPGRAFRFVTPGDAHTYLLDAELAGLVLDSPLAYLFAPAVFTGDDVDPAEISKFRLGGLDEEGVDENGDVLSGYEWLDAVINRPAQATNVLQLQ